MLVSLYADESVKKKKLKKLYYWQSLQGCFA